MSNAYAFWPNNYFPKSSRLIISLVIPKCIPCEETWREQVKWIEGIYDSLSEDVTICVKCIFFKHVFDTKFMGYYIVCRKRLEQLGIIQMMNLAYATSYIQISYMSIHRTGHYWIHIWVMGPPILPLPYIWSSCWSDILNISLLLKDYHVFQIHMCFNQGGVIHEQQPICAKSPVLSLSLPNLPTHKQPIVTKATFCP